MEETLTQGLNYDLIKKAIEGDEKALEKVLALFEPFHNSLLSQEAAEIDNSLREDWKVIMQTKLIDSIQKWRGLI